MYQPNFLENNPNYVYDNVNPIHNFPTRRNDWWNYYYRKDLDDEEDRVHRIEKRIIHVHEEPDKIKTTIKTNNNNQNKNKNKKIRKKLNNQLRNECKKSNPPKWCNNFNKLHKKK